MMLPSFQKRICASLSFICACARSRHPTLKAHLSALQGGCPPPPWCLLALHARILLDAETQLLQATRRVALGSGLITVPNSTRWTTGFGEPARTASTATSPPPGSLEELRLSVEQYVREVPADTAGRVGANFLEGVQMRLESGGAHFEHSCSNVKERRTDPIF